MHVLRGHPLRPICDEDRDVRPLECLHRSQERELLDAFVDAAAAADAGRVDEPDVPAAAIDDRVDGVARGPRNVRDDGALLARQPVQEARLPDVGPADDRDTRFAGLGRLLDRRRELLDDRVQQIARSRPLQRRYREKIAEPELVELRGLGLGAPGLGLVRGEQDRLAAAPEPVRDVVLDREDAGLRVDDEHDDVGLVDRRLRLFAHRRFDLALLVVQAAGVDERELAAPPFDR